MFAGRSPYVDLREYMLYSDIVDNLLTANPLLPLSANMGYKINNEAVSGVSSVPATDIEVLEVWDNV